jgi:hypothetical protein
VGTLWACPGLSPGPGPPPPPAGLGTAGRGVARRPTRSQHRDCTADAGLTTRRDSNRDRDRAVIQACHGHGPPATPPESARRRAVGLRESGDCPIMISLAGGVHDLPVLRSLASSDRLSLNRDSEPRALPPSPAAAAAGAGRLGPGRRRAAAAAPAGRRRPRLRRSLLPGTVTVAELPSPTEFDRAPGKPDRSGVPVTRPGTGVTRGSDSRPSESESKPASASDSEAEPQRPWPGVTGSQCEPAG